MVTKFCVRQLWTCMWTTETHTVPYVSSRSGHRHVPHVCTCKQGWRVLTSRVVKSSLWILQSAVQWFSDMLLNTVIWYSNQTCWVVFHCLTGSLNNTPTLTQPVLFLQGCFQSEWSWRDPVRRWTTNKKSKERDSLMRIIIQCICTVDEAGIPVCFSSTCAVGALSMCLVCADANFGLHRHEQMSTFTSKWTNTDSHSHADAESMN